MILDGRGVGEQAVDRDQGRKGGKEREQAIERDPSCDGEDAVCVDLLVDAPEDVLPASGGISVGEVASRPRPGSRLASCEDEAEFDGFLSGSSACGSARAGP